jgi:sugar phosphate isomerase/epimerase
MPSSHTVSTASVESDCVLGIQLYTVQSELIRDFSGTLETLRQIGYTQVEPSGLLGRSPREFKDALDAAGLAVPSAHILSKTAQQAMSELATGRLTANDAWNKVRAAMDLANIEQIMADMFEQQSVLGNQYLVLALDLDLLRSPEGVHRVVQAFNKAGQLCHDRGLEFAWHPHLNHANIGDKSAFERVLEATDPTRVWVELDFFWASLSNADIPGILQRHGNRLRLGHVKDLSRSAVVPPGGFTDLDTLPEDLHEDVGYGEIDYATLIPLARQAGMRYFFVERDCAPHPIESAQRSYSVLSTLLQYGGS